MESALATLMGLGIFLIVPVLVGIFVCTLCIFVDRRALKKSAIGQLTCLIDSDCPAGYICTNGICVPAEPQST